MHDPSDEIEVAGFRFKKPPTTGEFIVEGLDLEVWWSLMGRPVEIEKFRYRLEQRWKGTGLPPS